MRWEGRRKSSNVEDRRGARMSPKAAGIGGIGIVVVVVMDSEWIYLG